MERLSNLSNNERACIFTTYLITSLSEKERKNSKLWPSQNNIKLGYQNSCFHWRRYYSFCYSFLTKFWRYLNNFILQLFSKHFRRPLCAVTVPGAEDSEWRGQSDVLRRSPPLGAEAEKDIITTRVLRHPRESQAQGGGALHGLSWLCYVELGVQSKLVPSTIVRPFPSSPLPEKLYRYWSRHR